MEIRRFVRFSCRKDSQYVSFLQYLSAYGSEYIIGTPTIGIFMYGEVSLDA